MIATMIVSKSALERRCLPDGDVLEAQVALLALLRGGQVDDRGHHNLKGRTEMNHCLTRSDVTSVERGEHMSQCRQAPLGMRIEGIAGIGDSHFS